MIRIDTAAFGQAIEQKKRELEEMARPVAQAGAQVLYERARALAPVSEGNAHWFYGRGGRKYGPFAPGTLRRSIYQAYARSKSSAAYAEYHISWNPQKAPYGGMVEFGTSKATAHSFIGRAIAETRGQVTDAMKTKFAELAK
ncbi:HK97-gp10 family putative phage morphogenesis protein [Ramlibacter sp. MAHUQ-53]|uniref:HK97-gp10 family putative phage morphogenesis protein n=1 Tax=unclassified Ramlibacter TaxID=2617605 RepID=UPI00364369A2